MCGERGASLLVTMVLLALLLGLGLLSIRVMRMQVRATAYQRQSRSAFHLASSGLRSAAGLVAENPEYFHRQAYRRNPLSPSFDFPTAELVAPDARRMGRLEYRVVMSRPRLAGPPALYQVGGSAQNRFAFYLYQLDVVATINGNPVTGTSESGGSGALKQLRGDVRVGPILVGQ